MALEYLYRYVDIHVRLVDFTWFSLVGKYSSPMEPLGFGCDILRVLCGPFALPKKNTCCKFDIDTTDAAKLTPAFPGGFPPVPTPFHGLKEAFRWNRGLQLDRYMCLVVGG